MKEKRNLQDMPKGAKAWWSRSRRLMQKKGMVSSIPALKNTENKWVLDAKDKADLYVETFSKKCYLNAAEDNDYSELQRNHDQTQTRINQLEEKDAEKVLATLHEDSGTGPDSLPARILKNCSGALAKPVLLLTLCILQTGVWPDVWLQHWVAPLYKKKSVYQPGNYRGIHLTAQLSKVVERLLKLLYYPFLSATNAFGPRQFAYTTGRGARDALAVLLLTWVCELADGKKIAVYCSDVSGAFDRVRTSRLVAKLKQKRLHPQIVAVLTSWLQRRWAQIVVAGTLSDKMTLSDMVYQGTVTGPILWNLFFEDARHAINECFFTEVVYADDLNAYRVFPKTAKNCDMMRSLDNCQQELHKWGVANQVCFDAAKESQHVISISEPSGNNFRLLGVPFDPELSMVDAVSEIVSAAGWKLKTLLRTRRFYVDADLVVFYKSHLLGYLEYRTPAVYHSTRSVLCRLDAVQTRFLKDIGIDEQTALLRFHLAPLSARRDMALLGLIHRTVLGKGPEQFRVFFKLEDQSMALQDPRKTTKSPLIKRSMFGLIAIYNMLPARIRSAESVPVFQKGLQDFMITFAAAGFPQWSEVLSPRLPLSTHPLATFPNGCLR